jgi:hypothetical protein
MGRESQRNRDEHNDREYRAILENHFLTVVAPI